MTTRTEEPVADETPEVPDVPDVPDETPAQEPSGDSRRTLVVALVVVAILAAALAVWFRDQADSGDPAPAAGSSNTAVSDSAATAELTSQVEAAMKVLWSYDYRTLDQGRAALAEVTTDAFLTDYEPVYQRIEKLAPATKAVVTADVADIAVQTLDGDRAVLLVFLNQSAEKGGAQPLSAGARLRVSAERVDGAWKVSAVTPF